MSKTLNFPIANGARGIKSARLVEVSRYERITGVMIRLFTTATTLAALFYARCVRPAKAMQCRPRITEVSTQRAYHLILLKTETAGP